MVAAPKSNDYGRLGVMLQYFFDMELLIDVPPESFDPAPKIDSAVVRMIPVNTVSARRTISSISPNW